jgi:hypothetical protein
MLITSAEHYSSVLNKDFNYVTYLTTMQSEGMNYTRIFTGSYVEIPGSFGISNNTLAPSVGNFLAPWNRVDEIQNEPWADDPQKAMRLLKTHDPGKLNWANWAETAFEAVWMNYAWNRPINFDESGFAGSSDTTYLHTFLESFNYIQMKPDFEVVIHSPGLEWQALSETGKQYAIVFSGKETDWVRLNLPSGNYQYTFLSPCTGKSLKEGNLTSNGTIIELKLPEFVHMVSLKVISN